MGCRYIVTAIWTETCILLCVRSTRTCRPGCRKAVLRMPLGERFWNYFARGAYLGITGTPFSPASSPLLPACLAFCGYALTVRLPLGAVSCARGLGITGSTSVIMQFCSYGSRQWQMCLETFETPDPRQSPRLQALVSTEGAPPPPAALWSWPPICQDQCGDSCDVHLACSADAWERTPFGCCEEGRGRAEARSQAKPWKHPRAPRRREGL